MRPGYANTGSRGPQGVFGILGEQHGQRALAPIAMPKGAQVRTLFFGVNFGDVGLQGYSCFYLRNDLMHG